MHNPPKELLKQDHTVVHVPVVEPLTLAESRKGNRAGETEGWQPPTYLVGPLTAKAAPPDDLIGGKTYERPLPGARRQLCDPDADVEENFDQQPSEF